MRRLGFFVHVDGGMRFVRQRPVGSNCRDATGPRAEHGSFGFETRHVQVAPGASRKQPGTRCAWCGTASQSHAAEAQQGLLASVGRSRLGRWQALRGVLVVGTAGMGEVLCEAAPLACALPAAAKASGGTHVGLPGCKFERRGHPWNSDKGRSMKLRVTRRIWWWPTSGAGPRQAHCEAGGISKPR